MPKFLPLFLALLFGGSLLAQSSSISPNVGSAGQTLPIIISGQNTQYQSGSATVHLQYSQGSASISQGSTTGFMNIQVSSPTQITGTLVIPANVPNGSYDMLVVAGSSTVTFDQAAFTVQPATSNLIQVNPRGLKPGTTLSGMSISVPGASFKNAITGINKVWLSKGTTVLEGFSNIAVQNATTFTADFTAPANVPQGMYTMNVFENSGAMHVMLGVFEIANDVSLVEQPIFHFSYFPNPASDYLKVNYSEASPQTSFEILDLNGRRIQSFKVEEPEGQLEFQISALAKGSYLLKVTKAGSVLSVQKWIKY